MGERVKTESRPEAEVRLKRPPGYYASDNELVDDLAAEIGIYAFGVYHLLLRKAAQYAGVRISQRGIAGALAISTDSARNAIATLKNAGLIEERPSDDPAEPPLYLIVFAKDVMAARGERGERPEFRTRVRTQRVRNSGHDVCEIQDGVALNFGQGCAEFRTPNMEANKNQTEEQTTPPAPASGGEACVSGDGFDDGGEHFDREAENHHAKRRKRAEGQWSIATLEAAQAVMRECGFAKNPRLCAAIGDALEARVRQARCTLEDAKTLAIHNAREFRDSAHLMRFAWSWSRFFREAYWAAPNLWPYDAEKCERQRRRL